jgi:glycosyltransferase involved in cell wall biosynthesis
LKIAYIVNRYPHPSHTFIRREILGVEQHGHEVMRFSVRRPHDLVDPKDCAERQRTRAILANGSWRLLLTAALTAVARPQRFLRALLLALRTGWRSDRGLVVHLAYFIEACTLLRWSLGTDWMHAHFGTNSTTVAMLCAELGGPPFSFTVHGPEEFDKPEFLSLGEKIRRAAFVVAVSDFSRAQLFRWARPEDWRKIQVIRCGVADQFQHAPYVPPPPTGGFVCVGRFTEQKGHLILIEAAAQLASQGEQFDLTLAGDGPMRARIEDLISQRRLRDRVSITGWFPDDRVREEILKSRVLVLPSFAEGLPVVLMEALALGRPVIASAVAGIPELVEHGTCGWLVPAGSVQALANAMRSALACPPSRLEEMGRAGADRVARMHDASKEAERLALLLEEGVAVATHGRSPSLDRVRSCSVPS